MVLNGFIDFFATIIDIINAYQSYRLSEIAIKNLLNVEVVKHLPN